MYEINRHGRLDWGIGFNIHDNARLIKGNTLYQSRNERRGRERYIYREREIYSWPNGAMRTEVFTN